MQSPAVICHQLWWQLRGLKTNKQTDQMLFISTQHQIEVSGIVTVLCRSTHLIWFRTKGRERERKKKNTHIHKHAIFLFRTSHFVRVTHRLQRRTGLCAQIKSHNISFTTHQSIIPQLGCGFSYGVITCNDKMLISVLRVVRGVLDGACPGRAGWCRLVSATLESSAICRSRM